MVSFLMLNQTLSLAAEHTVPVVEDIISCSMLDGFLTHKIYKRDGKIKGHIAFPIVDIPLTPSELKQKQKEFEDWTDGPPPADIRKLGVSMPLISSNTMTSDQSRLNDRIAFFKSIFPDVERADFVSFDMGKLFLDFKNNECKITKSSGGLISAFCSTKAISEISGVPIERITFFMKTQQTTQLLPTSDGSEDLITRTQNSVFTSLTFHSKNKPYQSSFVYSPNENDRQCSVEGESLSEFID